MRNEFNDLEIQELIEKLNKHGYKEMVDAFLNNENKMYTKKGARLNKSGACRTLKVKQKQLEDMLKACKEILEKDYD